ncbi:MAG: hydantoinase B/oxoprolinase family protein [Alcaligenaceae bacterium]|nr:hydantoinase B/oxoprolinase family protein [Alcaligenaceae bacterium]
MKAMDPVEIALTQNRLDAITEQMGWVMTRTATSPIFSQSHDFSCFLTNAEGVIVAQADGIPIHTGSGGFVVPAILQDFDDISDGDVFLLNDPYLAGGNHLPDWAVARPIFVEEILVGFACNRAHQADIGGGAAGTYNTNATEIFHEGVRLPALRLVERGKTRHDLWKLLQANTRTPDAMDGDLRAMVGSTRIGSEGVEALVRQIGLTQIDAVFEVILDHADQRQRIAFSELPVGTYHAEEHSDNDCFELRDVVIRVALTIREDGSALIDFTGSDPQIKGFKNSSLANTYSAVLVAIAGFCDPDIPRNGGRFRAIEIIAPIGSIVNARAPAPMTMCTVFCAQDIIHAVWKALAQAQPERACAGWAKNIFGITAGHDERGPYVLYHGAMAAGAGAVHGRDGFNSIGHVVTYGGFVIPDVEVTEQQYPVEFLRQEFRCDTGGPGQWRGGTGVDYEIQIDTPASYSFRGEGLHTPSSYGTQGGLPGAAGDMDILFPDGAIQAAPKYGVSSLDPIDLRAH